MTVTGGMRERLISDSLHLQLTAALTALGWLTSSPARRDVTYLTRPAGDGEQITPNTLAVFSDRVPVADDLELGSGLAENRWQWYADVYAEDEAVGTHLSGDIRDVLRGKMPDVGASRPTVDVYDLRLATPVVIFSCGIEDVARDRPPAYAHPWQQFWFVVPFTVVDSYDT